MSGVFKIEETILKTIVWIICKKVKIFICWSVGYVTYSYADVCRNISNTIKTSGHSSKIYLSLYSKGFERVTKGFMRERWVEDWTELQHIDPPNLLATPVFLSRSPGLLNRGAWGPASPGTWFSFQHFLSSWSKLPVAPGYIIIWPSPTSCERHICTQFNPSTVKVIPWYLQPDAPVIYTGAFLIWQLGRVGGHYVTVSRLDR